MKKKKIKELIEHIRNETDGDSLIIKVRIGLIRFEKTFYGFYSATDDRKRKIIKDAMAQLHLSLSNHFGLFDEESLPKSKYE